MTIMQRILGIVGWLGTAIVFGAVAARLLDRAGSITLGDRDRYVGYAAIAGLVLVLIYTAGQWRDIASYFRRRQAKYGAIATAGVLVALGIVVAVNYLSSRQNKRWDLTANRQYTLSEQTVKLLENLDAPVKFIVFDRRANFDRFRTRLDEYAYHSSNLDIEYVDPDQRPLEARKYEVVQYGTVVIAYKDKVERVTTDSEQDITNGLIKALSGRVPKVYFLQGHGEKDPTRTERDGYSAVSEMLRRDNYTIERLALAQQKDVPTDATAVVIAGPTSDLLPQEVDALKRYLARAGKLMVLLDPPIASQGTAVPNLEGLLKEWAIEAGKNVVVDVSGATNEPSLAVAIGYPTHPITDRFETLTIYPVARSIDPVTGGASGRTAQAVVQTSQQSWAESNLATLTSGQGVRMETDAGDKAGPVTIAAAVSAPATDAQPAEQKAKTEENAPKPETRVVVFGDSDFASNAYAGLSGNPNLIANAVNWLAQQENLIAIRPKEAGDRRLTMTARQQMLLGIGAVFLIPAAVLGTGIYTWWRRR